MRLTDIRLIAAREVRARVRGRVFRAGTALILAGVTAAIVIPKLTKASASTARVGVAAGVPAAAREVVGAAAKRAGQPVLIVGESSPGAARSALRAGRLDLVVEPERLVVEKPISAGDTSTEATFVRDLAAALGTLRAYRQAGLSAVQASRLSKSRPFEIASLEAAHKNTIKTASIIGVILIFIMLTQYLTWTLMGVMEEKSSRVVEVLLSAVRPLQLLAGKVLGIGLVAMGQATVVVVFALGLAEAVGSTILNGAGPATIGSALLWLLLGYAFYSWVYAAAGSTIERQDQVQSLALPLSLPMILGYVMALVTAGSGTPSTFFEILAYLPPTAPFAMPILVGLGRVAPWQFAASVLISVAATVLVARVAAGVYRRAVLRTGGRVNWRELLRA